MRNHSILTRIILVLLALSIGTSATPARAATYGTITIDDYSSGFLTITFTVAGSKVDELIYDLTTIVILDGDCNALLTMPYTFLVSHPPVRETITMGMPLPRVVGPITVELFDTHTTVGIYEELRHRDRLMDMDSTDPEFGGCTR